MHAWRYLDAYRLHVNKMLVISVHFDQLVVSTAFDDFSFVHYAYYVCVSDCRQPVGDYKCGSVFHESVEGFLNEFFALAVKSRCSFVKNKY